MGRSEKQFLEILERQYVVFTTSYQISILNSFIDGRGRQRAIDQTISGIGFSVSFQWFYEDDMLHFLPRPSKFFCARVFHRVGKKVRQQDGGASSPRGESKGGGRAAGNKAAARSKEWTGEPCNDDACGGRTVCVSRDTASKKVFSHSHLHIPPFLSAQGWTVLDLQEIGLLPLVGNFSRSCGGFSYWFVFLLECLDGAL